MQDPRLTQLVNAWIDGSLTKPEKLELEQALLASASARRQFWNETSLHAVLYEAAKLEWIKQPAPAAVHNQSTHRLFDWFPHWSLLRKRVREQICWAVAFCCFALFAAFVVLRPGGNASRQLVYSAPEEPTSSGVAVLTHAMDVVWSDRAAVREAGTVLEPGWLKFNSGFLQIEFYSGARVLLEGPAEFKVLSRSEAFCRTGKLSAEVPAQARGFRIGSPRMTVIDLGTAFGFDVSNAGAEVHVFEGEVQFTYPGHSDEKQTLKQGAAVAVQSSGQLKAFQADQSTFASLTKLEEKQFKAQRSRYEQWRSTPRPFEQDPSLLLHFDFENLLASERTVPNQAKGAVPDGSLVGCERSEGRWPGKGAVEFKRISDRIRISIGGEFDSVTLAAWLRVDSIDNKFNSLMLSDGFEVGGLHWQITKEGRVRLGLGNGDPRRTQQMILSVDDYDSPVVFVPETMGQWVHLALVYDGANRRVTHFVNGNPVSTEPLKSDSALKLKIFAADIGNWNNATRVISTCPIRNFRGRMDEFSFFSRALSSSEIQLLYSHGSVQPEMQQQWSGKIL